MCRSIKFLRNPPATREEIEAAALQYVRKVSGFRKPSKLNADAFDMAVKRVADATESMLNLLGSKGAGGLDRESAPNGHVAGHQSQ